MNAGRFVLCVVIATAIFFVTDGVMHEVLLKSTWSELFASLGFKPSQESALAMLWFLFFELGRAVIAMAFYVLLRPRLGPGVNTALVSGTLSWVAFSLTGPPQMIPLQLMSVGLWLRMAAIQFVTSLVGAAAGAAAYKEA